MLTRRDRAAMVLALECLRGAHSDRTAADVTDDAREALYLGLTGADGDNACDALYAAMGDVWSLARARSVRLLRARLALYLRAVLRADERERSDDGWNFATPPVRTVVCDRCAQVLPFYEVSDVVNVCPADGKPARARYARPLWELAPSSGRGR